VTVIWSRWLQTATALPRHKAYVERTGLRVR
jgi:hypothetical protein